MSMFRKAVKQEAKLRLAISGPSGSGKTFTSLAIASALGGLVAVVDTEHGSASKYADRFAFDVAEMHPPFHPDKFIAAIADAAEAGYSVIILDSISHAWSGTGGILDIVDEATKRIKGNSYMAWKEGTPVQNKLVDAIVQSGIHVIATMRSKTEYVVEKNERGKDAPRKVGTAPIQRDGFEYEFDVVFDMDIDNNAIVTKTRCPELAGRVFAKPGKQVADILAAWLSGEPAQTSKADGEGRAKHDPPLAATAKRPASAPEPAPTNGNGKHGDDKLPFEPNPEAAYEWAIGIGASENIYAARNAFKRMVDEDFGGKLTKANAAEVYAHWYVNRMDKLQMAAQPQPA